MKDARPTKVPREFLSSPEAKDLFTCMKKQQDQDIKILKVRNKILELSSELMDLKEERITDNFMADTFKVSRDIISTWRQRIMEGQFSGGRILKRPAKRNQ